MPRRVARPDRTPDPPRGPSAALLCAVRLSLVPGLTLAEASRRTGVSLATLRRGRKTLGVSLTRDDLIFAALSANGARSEGPVGDLAHLASWIDYVNHDGTSAAEVARDLERLARAGRIALEAGRFRLLVPWP